MAKIVKREFLGPRKVYDVTVEGTHSFFAASSQGTQTSAVLAHNCHQLSKAAMDALLLPMENVLPGSRDKRLVCLFCTTELEKLRGTIRSRCMTFDIKSPTKDAAVERLRYICGVEGLAFEEDALEMIFANGRGHVRDMVSSLERVSRSGDITLQNTRVALGLDVVSAYYDILIQLAQGSLEDAVATAVHALGRTDVRSLYKGMTEAALASHRVEHGITLGLSYIDVKKARELYALLQEDVVFLAKRLSETPYQVDTQALFCDLALLGTHMERKTLDPQASVKVVTRQVEVVRQEASGETETPPSPKEATPSRRFRAPTLEEEMSMGKLRAGQVNPNRKKKTQTQVSDEPQLEGRSLVQEREDSKSLAPALQHFQRIKG